MRVETYLRESAHRFSDKTALIVRERRVSYAELYQTADRLANVFQHSGVERGDRVVIMADSSVETVAAIFATLEAGAVFCPINPTVKSAKLAYILKNCQAKSVVTPARLLPIVREAIDQAQAVVATLVHDARPAWPRLASCRWERWSRRPHRPKCRTAESTSTWACSSTPPDRRALPRG